MIIEVLVCRPDGTQELVQREVPDNWYDPSPPPPEQPDANAMLEAIRILTGGADDELDSIIGAGA